MAYSIDKTSEQRNSSAVSTAGSAITAKGVRLHSTESDERGSPNSLTPLDSSAALIPKMESFEMQDQDDHGKLDSVFRDVNNMSAIIGDPTIRKFESTEYLNLSLHQVSVKWFHSSDSNYNDLMSASLNL